MKVGHDTERGLRFVKSKRVLVSSLTEMDPGRGLSPYIGLAKRVFGRGYHVLTDPNAGVHSEEIPIIFRLHRWNKILDFKVWQISPDVGELGTGNDRYLARLRYKQGRKIHVHFAIHTNAGVQNIIPPNPTYRIFTDTERWKVSVPAWEFTENKVREAIKDPSVTGVILQGDVNVMPQGDGLTNRHSPYVVVRRLGMHYVNERVTMMAYHGLKKQSVRVCPPGSGGWPSDHAALIVRFKT